MNEIFNKIYKNSKQSFYELLYNSLKNEKKMFVVTANPETCMLATTDSEMETLLNDDVIIVPDGIGVVKAADMLGYPLEERITGVDMAEKLLEYGNTLKKSIFILGSKQEVLDKLKNVLDEKYTSLKILSLTNGYVDNKDQVFDEMKKMNPDIILVALGVPNQEKLIYKHFKDFHKGIFVGVGGSLDVLSGSKKRAPSFFVKLNLEWLYRICREPSRIKRFYNNNVKFLNYIRKQK